MATGTRLIDKYKLVVGLHAVTPPAASPKWVSLRGYNHLTAIITFKNATTVTGSWIQFSQAKDVSGTGAKTLGFTEYFAVLDDSSSVALTKVEASGSQFITSNVDSKSGFYVVEIDASTLDVNNGFGCIQAVVGDATATTIEVLYVLGSTGRYEGDYLSLMDPLAN